MEGLKAGKLGKFEPVHTASSSSKIGHAVITSAISRYLIIDRYLDRVSAEWSPVDNY
jgi:hypothetical protein